MVLSRTMTAPTCLRSQVEREATSAAIFMKYWCQSTRTRCVGLCCLALEAEAFGDLRRFKFSKCFFLNLIFILEAIRFLKVSDRSRIIATAGRDANVPWIRPSGVILPHPRY